MWGIDGELLSTMTMFKAPQTFGTSWQKKIKDIHSLIASAAANFDKGIETVVNLARKWRLLRNTNIYAGSDESVLCFWGEAKNTNKA